MHPVLHPAVPAPAADHGAPGARHAASHAAPTDQATKLAVAGTLAARQPVLVAAEYAVLALCTVGTVYLILFG